MTQPVLFLTSVFVVTWSLGFLWPLPTAPQSLWEFLAPLLPVVWAPTIIALLLTGSFEGAAGLGTELRLRLRYPSGSGRWLVIAGAIPILVTTIGVLSAWAVGDRAPFIPTSAILSMVIVQLVTGAVGEELGWRGFLLPRLGRQVGPLRAAVSMACLWSLWHVPAFFTPGMPHQLMPMLPMLAFVASFGMFMAFVFNRAHESVLATILAHFSLNVTLGLGGAQLSSVVFWLTMMSVYVVIAALIYRSGKYHGGFVVARS